MWTNCWEKWLRRESWESRALADCINSLNFWNWRVVHKDEVESLSLVRNLKKANDVEGKREKEALRLQTDLEERLRDS